MNRFALLIGVSVLAVSQASAQSIVNGDFESGNTGFTSAYTYIAPGSQNPGDAPDPLGFDYALWDAGTYSVGTNPMSFHASFASFGDHTTGTGNMLVVNGAASPVTIWQGTLTSALVPGTTYEFSAWVANLFPPDEDPIAPAQLSFSVGGNDIGDTYTAPDVGVWHEFTATFVAGSEPIAVVDLATAANGNDFALDDISLTPIPEPTSLALGGLGLVAFGYFKRQERVRNK